VYASGQAATTAVLFHHRPRRVAIRRGGYHGTHAAIDALAPFGVEKVALDAPLAKGDLVWLETPRNPTCEMEDIAVHAARARDAGAVLVVDSTFATPVLQNPLALGADVVMHSTTKFISGHSDALGGALVARDDGDLFRRVRAFQTAGGVIPSPFECWLTLRGIRTLPWRMRAHSSNAERVARFLAGHPNVTAVHYPGLESDPGHSVAKRQMALGGGMLSVEVRGGREAAMGLTGRLRIFTRATSLGGTESLIEHRASVEGAATRAPEGLLRVSVGLENADDLVEDLERALVY
jgi:cystathionine gamma-synthase